MTMSFLVNREVRIIPKGWRHPKDEGGRYSPLRPVDLWPATAAARAAWVREYEEEPKRADFMPDPGVTTEIALYETTSEGTPISPPFADTAEGRLALVNWCAGNARTWGEDRADPETWAAILFGDTPAAVDEEGSVHFR
jgi:hypothetical protein